MIIMMIHKSCLASKLLNNKSDDNGEDDSDDKIILFNTSILYFNLYNISYITRFVS